jgi:hypothetical protein
LDGRLFPVSCFELTQEVIRVTEALKFDNARLPSVEKLQKAMYYKLVSNVEVDQNDPPKTWNGGKGYTV